MAILLSLFYGGVVRCGNQIRWLPQVSASMEVCVRYTGCHRPQVSVSVEVCVRHAGCHRHLSLWRYVYYYTVWGGVIYVQVYRQKLNAVRACVGVVRWLYSAHYSVVGVVRCVNQKVMATLDSLLLYGACPYVDGCH